MEGMKRLVIFCFFVGGVVTANGAHPHDRQLPRQIPPSALQEGFLYFSDAHHASLKAEKTMFPSHLDNYQLGREILTLLFHGPSKDGYQALWPGQTRLNAFFISTDGTAYVDISLPDQAKLQMDVRKELLAVYSLVNSLTVNISKIKQVKILKDGKEAQTLAGHVDLEYIYLTNMLIVK
jgi:hypothetical protein